MSRQTDDICCVGEDLAALLAARGARPIAEAPKNGTILRLLIDYNDGNRGEEGHPLADTLRFAWTIGHNNFDHDGEDEWQMAGWCWSHDHYTAGHGTPVGFLPFFDQGPR